MFEALSSAPPGRYCLFSCFCNGEPAAAITAVAVCPSEDDGVDAEYVHFAAVRLPNSGDDDHRPRRPRPRRLSVPAQGQRRQDLRGKLPVPDVGVRAMSDTPQVLLEHRLKTLKLPTFLREYEKVARRSAHEGLDHVEFLSRLVELELIDRERRLVERRIRAAKFPTVKSLDSFEFKAIPSPQQDPGARARPM